MTINYHRLTKKKIYRSFRKEILCILMRLIRKKYFFNLFSGINFLILRFIAKTQAGFFCIESIQQQENSLIRGPFEAEKYTKLFVRTSGFDCYDSSFPKTFIRGLIEQKIENIIKNLQNWWNLGSGVIAKTSSDLFWVWQTHFGSKNAPNQSQRNQLYK